MIELFSYESKNCCAKCNSCYKLCATLIPIFVFVACSKIHIAIIYRLFFGTDWSASLTSDKYVDEFYLASAFKIENRKKYILNNISKNIPKPFFDFDDFLSKHIWFDIKKIIIKFNKIDSNFRKKNFED
ncbi:hypothetical protein BpHYR1_032744 [Brachionus plicatilis]|uniref:Uncharacterized protein n=1 Tax=Brachionus plicatilis TaxID=10195 RepID=A0A3M7P457_BRAPC|nr:hypothetical protein BpHYR1_032744 [Brachionus plicatilis]